MFSQRFIYGSVIAFLFLLVIYQGILLLRVNANSGTGKTVIQSREAEGAASLRAGILSSDVQVLLDEVAGSKICHADMYVITPPESCRACAMQESAFFDASVLFGRKKHCDRKLHSTRIILVRFVAESFREFYSNETGIRKSKGASRIFMSKV